MNETQLYFGYGSNLDWEDWSGFCARRGFDPTSLRPVAPAVLPDETLVFDHYSERRKSFAANIRPHLGGLVEGCLFEASKEGWTALDAKEGAPFAYRREAVIVLDAKGDEIRAVTYRSQNPGGPGQRARPGEPYLAICRAGRERFGLDASSIDSAAEGESVGCDLVFVYGTLMRGEKRASAWEDLDPDRVLLASSPGGLRDHGCYPGLDLKGRGLVLGEVLRFKTIGDALNRFDRIEGFDGFGARGNLYRRTLTAFSLVDGPAQRAWTYVTGRPDAPAIPSNDWRAHRGVRLDFCKRLAAEHARRRPDFLQIMAENFNVASDMADVVNFLASTHCERALSSVSEDWAVRLPPQHGGALHAEGAP